MRCYSVLVVAVLSAALVAAKETGILGVRETLTPCGMGDLGTKKSPDQKVRARG
jgi:hypothetical protein